MRITILGLSEEIRDILLDEYGMYIKSHSNTHITFTSDVMIKTLPDCIELYFYQGGEARIMHCDYWRIEIE